MERMHLQVYGHLSSCICWGHRAMEGGARREGKVAFCGPGRFLRDGCGAFDIARGKGQGRTARTKWS